MKQENQKSNQDLTREELQAKAEALEKGLAKGLEKRLEKRAELTTKKIKKLKRELELATIKAEAYSTMIDIAEEAFKIPIRKTFSNSLPKDNKPEK